MKLVVGLGNPGGRYNFTRHNFGFLVLDYYAKTRNLPKWESRLGALACRSNDTWFVKPQDFYNLSGKAVGEFMRYYKIDLSDVLVVCDNFDLEFGLVRYRASGLAGGNNGLKSVDSELRTSEYARLRLGTGNDALRRQMGDVDFVLSKFTPEEKERLPEILDAACERIEEFVN